MSDLSKKLSIHTSSSLLNSLFFLPDLLCIAIRRLNVLVRVPITSAIFLGLDGSDISVLQTPRFKICSLENAEDVVGVVYENDVAGVACN